MADDKSEEQISQEDFDYIADSKAALVRRSPKAAWLTLYLIVAIIAFGLIWSYFAVIPEATVADGRVVSSTNLQVIQNLEGGIVRKINVKQGDLVEIGEVVVQLDDTRFSSAYKEDLAKSAVLQARVARLTAESAGDKKITFPESIKAEHPELIKNENKLFRTNQAALNASLKVLYNNYALTEQELKIIAPLVKEGVMSRLEKIRLDRDLNAIEGKISDKIDSVRREADADLNKANAELTVLRQALLATKDRLERTTIRSPIQGIVNKVYVTTVGEVIRPGVRIMEIVPYDKNLTVQVQIAPEKIAFIKLGQKASVRVNAYDAVIYGSLDAVVESISADTITDKEGKSFYEVKLKTDRNYLGRKEQPLPIIPGMTVTAHILTAEKTLLNYLLKPFFRAKQGALRER